MSKRLKLREKSYIKDGAINEYIIVLQLFDSIQSASSDAYWPMWKQTAFWIQNGQTLTTPQVTKNNSYLQAPGNVYLICGEA